MAKKNSVTPESFSANQGGSGTAEVIGSVQSFKELTKEDFMKYPAEIPVTPSWKKTRYPVSKEEHKRLCMEARAPQDQSRSLDPDNSDSVMNEDLESIHLSQKDIPEDVPSRSMAPSPLAPSTGNSFAGIPSTGWDPPDCTIAVGPDHVLLGANVELAGYQKDGTQSFRWPSFTHLFSRVIPTGASLFDPQLIYDHYEDRWLALVAAKRESPKGSWCLLAASQGPDPTGSWNIWALDGSKNGANATNNWMDYPQMGFDAQGIYIGMNQFDFDLDVNGNPIFRYSKIRILNKTEVYAGGTISYYDFWDLKNPDDSTAFSVIPCNHYRGAGGNPPAYFINSHYGRGDDLTVWTLSNPLGYWSGTNTTLTKVSVSCRHYENPPDAIQKDSNIRIETGDTRIQSAIFQYAGDTQRIWACHTDRGTWNGDTEARSVLQWYEIDVPTKTIIQQSVYGASGMYYYYPALQTDINRNAYMVFSRSSASQFVSLRQTGRRVTANLNSMEGSRLVKAGESSYTGARWGDYFGMCRDGGDSGRVWGYGEYAAQRNRWGTWVFSAKYGAPS